MADIDLQVHVVWLFRLQTSIIDECLFGLLQVAIARGDASIEPFTV